MSREKLFVCGVEMIKQRITIYLAVFQYSLAAFIAMGASLSSYAENHARFDAIYGIHVTLMIFSFTIAVPSVLAADKQASLL